MPPYTTTSGTSFYWTNASSATTSTATTCSDSTWGNAWSVLNTIYYNNERKPKKSEQQKLFEALEQE